jgi:hypothetical protein
MIRFPFYVVNLSVPLVVALYPNPKNIKVSQSKINSKNFCLGGIVTEHFGSDFSVMNVEGRTQALVGDFDNELAVEATLFTLQQLYRLDKVETLSLLPAFKPTGGSISSFFSNASSVAKQLVTGTIDPATLRTLSSTILYYRYDFYVGYFQKFFWEQSAEQPRVYEYSFEFIITQTGQNMLADMMFMPTTVHQAQLSTAIGLAASSAAIPNLIRSFTALGQDITNGFTANPALGAGVGAAVALSAAGKALF